MKKLDTELLNKLVGIKWLQDGVIIPGRTVRAYAVVFYCQGVEGVRA